MTFKGVFTLIKAPESYIQGANYHKITLGPVRRVTVTAADKSKQCCTHVIQGQNEDKGAYLLTEPFIYSMY